MLGFQNAQPRGVLLSRRYFFQLFQTRHHPLVDVGEDAIIQIRFVLLVFLQQHFQRGVHFMQFTLASGDALFQFVMRLLQLALYLFALNKINQMA